MRLAREADGQATVEVAALVPLAAVVCAAVLQVLAGGAAAESADAAAEAGAVALVQGGDAREAARAALPASARRRSSIVVSGRRVRVRVEPRSVLPGAGALLAATAEADAGPEGDG